MSDGILNGPEASNYQLILLYIIIILYGAAALLGAGTPGSGGADVAAGENHIQLPRNQLGQTSVVPGNPFSQRARTNPLILGRLLRYNPGGQLCI